MQTSLTPSKRVPLLVRFMIFAPMLVVVTVGAMKFIQDGTWTFSQSANFAFALAVTLAIALILKAEFDRETRSEISGKGITFGKWKFISQLPLLTSSAYFLDWCDVAELQREAFTLRVKTASTGKKHSINLFLYPDPETAFKTAGDCWNKAKTLNLR